jgi:hypothetical protein
MKSMHSPSTDLRRLTTAEFARMSRSLQLTLLVIRRAQLASRKVLAATPDWRERYGTRAQEPISPRRT